MHSMHAHDKSWHVHHNSDWSGEAYVIFTDEHGNKREVALPGEVLVAIGKEAYKSELCDKVIAFVEQL